MADRAISTATRAATSSADGFPPVTCHNGNGNGNDSGDGTGTGDGAGTGDGSGTGDDSGAISVAAG